MLLTSWGQVYPVGATHTEPSLHESPLVQAQTVPASQLTSVQAAVQKHVPTLQLWQQVLTQLVKPHVMTTTHSTVSSQTESC